MLNNIFSKPFSKKQLIIYSTERVLDDFEMYYGTYFDIYWLKVKKQNNEFYQPTQI